MFGSTNNHLYNKLGKFNLNLKHSLEIQPSTVTTSKMTQITTNSLDSNSTIDCDLCDTHLPKPQIDKTSPRAPSFFPCPLELEQTLH